MKRAHDPRDEAVARREWSRHVRDHERMYVDMGGFDQVPWAEGARKHCPCEEAVGMFRKKKGRGCPKGRRCWCKRYKDTPPHRQEIADLRYRQQLDDQAV